MQVLGNIEAIRLWDAADERSHLQTDSGNMGAELHHITAPGHHLEG